MSPRYSRLQICAGALIAACLLLSASCAGGQKGVITRQRVAAILDEIDEAARSKDVDAIIKHLAEDARIKLSIKGPDATSMEMNFTRDQYRDYFKQSFDLMDPYEYERRDTVINVDPDGQSAVAADEVFEAATAGGQTIRSVTRETATFKLEGGRAVITSLEGTCRWNQPGGN